MKGLFLQLHRLLAAIGHFSWPVSPVASMPVNLVMAGSARSRPMFREEF
jgi:hypothetical protein